MKKINYEEISFGIISKVGEAKYDILKSFDLSKENKIKDAINLLEKARAKIGEAGKLHMEVIAAEANNIPLDFSALFMHAEDQFLTTQTLGDVIERMIYMQEEINKLKNK